jgi:hypothetical protein
MRGSVTSARLRSRIAASALRGVIGLLMIAVLAQASPSAMRLGVATSGPMLPDESEESRPVPAEADDIVWAVESLGARHARQRLTYAPPGEAAASSDAHERAIRPRPIGCPPSAHFYASSRFPLRC